MIGDRFGDAVLVSVRLLVALVSLVLMFGSIVSVVIALSFGDWPRATFFLLLYVAAVQTRRFKTVGRGTAGRKFAGRTHDYYPKAASV